jgi:hypothetical protein
MRFTALGHMELELREHLLTILTQICSGMEATKSMTTYCKLKHAQDSDKTPPTMAHIALQHRQGTGDT